MNRRYSGLALLAVLSSAAAAVPVSQADPCAAVDWAAVKWDPYYVEDGIQVWRRDIPGCPLIAFRGSGTISEPVGKVLSVILDTRRESEWVEGLLEARVLRGVSPSEDYEYCRIASGFFLIEDREIVSHNVLTFDRRSRRAIVDTSSAELSGVPRKSGTVLAKLEHSTMIIASEDGGRRTSFTMEALFDPRGLIPKWMVNSFQKKFPVQTIRKIRAQARRPDVSGVPPHPGADGIVDASRREASMKDRRRRARILLFASLSALVAPLAGASAAPEGLDQALCGPPSRADEPEKLARLEPDMPPVLDQAPTSWCYAFSATDVLNYYIHKTNGTPYDDAHLLSPIDAVAAQRYYDDQYHLGTLSDPPGHISVKSGGNPYDVFVGVQELPAMRSSAQVPFSSSGSSDPAIRALIGRIKLDEKREEEEGGDPAEVSKEIKTFRIVNAALFNAAREKQWTDPEGETLDHYHDLVQTLAGPPDLKIPPFTAEVYKTEDQVRYLNKVRDNLASGYPMNVSVTTTDVFPELLKNGRKAGGEHAMTVVGAGYEGGACTVRLRNSWGIKSKHGSPGKGYVDLPVGRFLAAVGDYAILKNKAAGFKIEWISAPDAQGPPQYVGRLQRLVGYQGDGTEYYGRSIQHVRDDRKVKFTYIEGTHRAKDGSLKIYANGELRRVERLASSKGGVYTGEVTERETTPDHYKISYVKGVLEYPDGRRVLYPKE